MNENPQYFGAIGKRFEYVYIIALNIDIATEIAEHHCSGFSRIIEISGGDSTVSGNLSDIFKRNNVIQGYYKSKMLKPESYVTRNELLDDLINSL